MALAIAPQLVPDRSIKEYIEEATAPKKIGLIKFGLMSGVDVMKLSHLQIVNTQIISTSYEKSNAIRYVI
jgi:hypothetical protein